MNERTSIFEVRAKTGNEDQYRTFGSTYTREEAEVLLIEAKARVARAGGKSQTYWVEEIDTTDLFRIPSKPTPRERFTYQTSKIDNGPGITQSTQVEVLDGDQVIVQFDRNYYMGRTFEPFRQGDKNYALISPDYTATSVLDLQTGQIIAGEEENAWGFCPVGFYVPDWWDIHDGSILPGSKHWRDADHTWPNGEIGFVWGCVWGDDNGWKVQALDLSRVSEGILARDERFGYLEISTRSDNPKDFIRISSYQGKKRVTFLVPQDFDIESGQSLSEED